MTSFAAASSASRGVVRLEPMGRRPPVTPSTQTTPRLAHRAPILRCVASCLAQGWWISVPSKRAIRKIVFTSTVS